MGWSKAERLRQYAQHRRKPYGACHNGEISQDRTKMDTLPRFFFLVFLKKKGEKLNGKKKQRGSDISSEYLNPQANDICYYSNTVIRQHVYERQNIGDFTLVNLERPKEQTQLLEYQELKDGKYLKLGTVKECSKCPTPGEIQKALRSHIDWKKLFTRCPITVELNASPDVILR